MPTTPHHGFATPIGIDLDDVPTWVLLLATQVEAKLSGFRAGTLAGRPAASSGRIYWATDTTTLFFSDGSTWRAFVSNTTRPMGYWAPPPVSYPVGTPQPAFARLQIPWGANWQLNGFNTVGGWIQTPSPGVYRIHATLAMVGYGVGPWGYVLSIERPNGEVLMFSARNTDWPGAFTPLPFYDLDATLSFDHSDADHESFGIFVNSAKPYQVEGAGNTYLQAELACAL